VPPRARVTLLRGGVSEGNAAKAPPRDVEPPGA